MNKRNYQKELDRLIENITKEGKFHGFFFTAAVHRAAVMCWNIYLSILSTVFFYNPNTHWRKNTVSESQRFAVW